MSPHREAFCAVCGRGEIILQEGTISEIDAIDPEVPVSALQTLIQQWRGDAKMHDFIPIEDATGFEPDPETLRNCADALEALLSK